jgi:hypothetical protein
MVEGDVFIKLRGQKFYERFFFYDPEVRSTSFSCCAPPPAAFTFGRLTTLSSCPGRRHLLVLEKGGTVREKQ